MGHWCRICKENKPNEKFSGKGHKNHICKQCARKPKEEIADIDPQNEIYNFLAQSNISKRNISRLRKLKESQNKNTSYFASIALDVAKIKPHKKRRLKIIARQDRDLLQKLKETGLIMAHHH